MASNISIIITERKKSPFSKRKKYRWVAKGVNGKVLAKASHWYSNWDDMIHVLHLLYGPKFNGHKLFQISR